MIDIDVAIDILYNLLPNIVPFWVVPFSYTILERGCWSQVSSPDAFLLLRLAHVLLDLTNIFYFSCCIFLTTPRDKDN